MSLEALPNEIKYKLLEKCPQLRFVFSELRTLLRGFEKPVELEYPYKMNKNRKLEIIEYIGLQLEFINKNMECISSSRDITNIEYLAIHKILPLLIVGCSSSASTYKNPNKIY